jgi:hypothetical protein
MDAQITNNDKTVWSELQDAAYAALNCKAVTQEARKITSTLCERITATELRLGKRQHKRGVKKAEQLRTAVAGQRWRLSLRPRGRVCGENRL